MKTQDMVVFDVEKIVKDQTERDALKERLEWNVSFGPDRDDPHMTITKDQIGREPNIGDIITVQLPVALSIRKP